MRISDILRHKGPEVRTIGPEASVRTLLRLLAEHNVGALVVTAGDGALCGIVSERDVARRLDRDGPAVLDTPLSRIMTTEVFTCGPQDQVDDVMRVVTEHRVRHMPVLSGDGLVGIVSIGDLVRARIDELEQERDHLHAYISS